MTEEKPPPKFSLLAWTWVTNRLGSGGGERAVRGAPNEAE